MLNSIPIVGWLIDFVVKVSLAVPFWLIWSVAGLGSKYFYFLPQVYLQLPFWHCVGLFMILPILKAMVVPSFASVSQSNENKTK